jgi:hypothetical protein
MYRKIKTRRLLLIAAILILAVAGLTLKDYFIGDRSFRKFVISVDTNNISSLSISTGILLPKTITIFKDQNSWKVKGNEQTYSADPSVISKIVSDLASLKIESLAANSSMNWSEFEVTDSSATKVSIEENGNKKSTTIFIGKFSYQRPTNQYERQGKLSTYVRVAGQQETYCVDGFLRMNFTTDVNNYRNKSITKTSSELFSKLIFTYAGDSSFTLEKDNKKWVINGIPVDSLKAAGYLSDLEHLSSAEFADTVKHNAQASFTLKIEDSALPIPIEIKAFKREFGDGYLVNSSYNPEALFNGSAQNLVSKIFRRKQSFLK